MSNRAARSDVLMIDQIYHPSLHVLQKSEVTQHAHAIICRRAQVGREKINCRGLQSGLLRNGVPERSSLVIWFPRSRSK